MYLLYNGTCGGSLILFVQVLQYPSLRYLLTAKYNEERLKEFCLWWPELKKKKKRKCYHCFITVLVTLYHLRPGSNLFCWHTPTYLKYYTCHVPNILSLVDYRMYYVIYKLLVIHIFELIMFTVGCFSYFAFIFYSYSYHLEWKKLDVWTSYP